MGLICIGVRPNKSNRDFFPLESVRCIKLTLPILKFANLGRVQDASLAIRPIKAPLMSLGIIQAQGQTLEAAGDRAVGLELLQLSAATPNLSRNRSAVKFNPGRRAG